MPDGMPPVDSVARKYAVLRPHLDERQRRLFLVAEAREFGRGGIKLVAAATGVHPDMIARGVRELTDEADRRRECAPPVAAGRAWPSWIQDCCCSSRLSSFPRHVGTQCRCWSGRRSRHGTWPMR